MNNTKERIIKFLNSKALLVLIIVALVAANAAEWVRHELLPRPANKVHIKNEYPYIDVSRSFIDQEDFIVNIHPLREKLYMLAEEFSPGNVSIYVEFLNTGANIAVNPQAYIYPASLLKVPVAMAVMKKVEVGEWSLDDTYLSIHESDKDPLSGNFENLVAELPTGTEFTVRELLEKMLIKSDNTCYRILLRNVGEVGISEVHEAIGLEALLDPEGRVSAKEYSRVLRSLYTASYLRRAQSEQILKWLDEAEFNEFISKPVDPLVPFPHKYGVDIEKMAFSDSGIVYLADRPYMISVMVEGQVHGDKDKEFARAAVFMQRVSEEVHSYFVSYEQ